MINYGTPSDNRGVYVFLDGADLQIEHAAKILAGVPGGIYRAVGSTLKRTGQHGLTVGMKIAAEDYAASQSNLKSYVKNKNTIVRDSGGSYEVTFGYRGRVIPLIHFDVGISSNGGVAARVLRKSARKQLDNAFIARMGGHTGVFEREGSARFPVKELYGPWGGATFSVREETVDKMSEEMINTYNGRIDHEIMRVLNGWG